MSDASQKPAEKPSTLGIDALNTKISSHLMLADRIVSIYEKANGDADREIKLFTAGNQ